MKNLLWCAVLMCGVAGAQTPAAENPLAVAKTFPLEGMEMTKSATGVETRRVVAGTLATGESVNLHETTQPAGTTPSPLHPIQHSELIVVVSGTVEFHHDGKAERVGPGGVIYVALGTQHFVKNAGDGPAQYVVIAIGGDVKK